MPFWLLLLVVALLFGAAFAALALGVMFKRPCLRGTCGSAPVVGARGEDLSCATCPNRKRRAA
jgi:hypothetical protein